MISRGRQTREASRGTEVGKQERANLTSCSKIPYITSSSFQQGHFALQASPPCTAHFHLVSDPVKDKKRILNPQSLHQGELRVHFYLAYSTVIGCISDQAVYRLAGQRYRSLILPFSPGDPSVTRSHGRRGVEFAGRSWRYGYASKTETMFAGVGGSSLYLLCLMSAGSLQ